MYEYKQIIIGYCSLGPQGVHQLIDKDSTDEQLVPVPAECSHAGHRQFTDNAQFEYEVLDAVADNLRDWFQDTLLVTR